MVKRITSRNSKTCAVVPISDWLARRMEFVKIEPFNSIPMRSLTANQTADMIRVAAKRPDERLAMSELPLPFKNHRNEKRVFSRTVASETQLRQSA